jgi:hypothetical protein
MIKYKITDNLKVCILCALCLLSAEPWFFWGAVTELKYIGMFYIVLMLFVTKAYRVESLLFLILYVYIIIFKSAEYYYLYSASGIAILFLLFIANEDETTLIRSFRISRNIFSSLLVPGMVLYLLHYMIRLPSFIVVSRNLDMVDNYRCYTFFVEAIQDIDFLPRFRFLFDEAGVVGTLCLYFLLIDKFNLRNRQNVIIFLGGVLSFSLFFYLGTIMFLIFINIKSIKKIIVYVIMIIMTIILFNDNAYFNNLIMKRLIVTDDGLRGNNRTSISWDTAFNYFAQSDAFYFGKGTQSLEGVDFAKTVASYQTYVYQYGLLGVLLLFLIYSIVIRKRINTYNTILLVMGLGACFYQRPWIFQYFNPIFIYFAIANFNLMEKGDYS